MKHGSASERNISLGGLGIRTTRLKYQKTLIIEEKKEVGKNLKETRALLVYCGKTIKLNTSPPNQKFKMKVMKVMKVISWNIRGLNGPSK